MKHCDRRASRGEVALVAFFAVAPLLPFVTKAVSIDAPVFISVAQQIIAHPFDPFGFQMIWDPTSADAWVFNRNPPLVSYYLAPWILLFGEVDTWLHVAMLPFSLLSGLAFLGIARRVTGEGARPALLLIASPAYLVLATTLMLDIPLLAFMLFGVYAMLRGAEGERAGWQLAAGMAAAAAGLTKYVGFCIAPLLAAGVVFLYSRRPRALLCVLLPPLAIWGLWGAYTANLYGSIHFAGATDVVFDSGRFGRDEFWNHLFSGPIFFGSALVFPIFLWARALFRGNFATGLAVIGVLLGAVAVTWVLPGGEPSRRHPIETDEAIFGALGFAGAFLLWSLFLRPGRLRASEMDRFLLLWLGGLLVFTLFLNWHVNVADALLAAPVVVLLVFRDADLRPSHRTLAAWLAILMPASMLLAWADMKQANVYRDAAGKIAAEIGERSGARYFVGQWGLQHYLEREGFQAVVPAQYGRSDLEVGDWVASSRNVYQLDVEQNMNEFEIRRVRIWKYETRLPLRTTNPDAGSGFYSHRSGYVPFAWSDAPIESVGLGRVVSVRSRSR